jgi:hypothetical protein
MSQKELFYICHYCIDHRTPNRKDMIKHLNRKNNCKCNNPIVSYETAKLLTLSKKYYFHININELMRNDLLFIINHYCYEENHIYDNYYQSIMNNINSNKKEEIKEEEENDEKEEDDEFKKMYYNKEKNKYVCDKCNSEYISKQNMLKHLNNKKACKYKQNINQVINESKNYSELILQKKKKEEEELNSHIVQNINQNIKNINQNINQNFQNINNIQSNNNNSQNNTFQLSLRDFVNERYDISHIKDSFYQQKDFFLYNNFLKMIMENEKNQNIFFANNEAIVYTDNELNKMSSDKAGYLILDKLSQSFNQLYYQQDKEAQEYFAFIVKYYSVLKGQYKHDTIYKDYNVDEQRFFYTSNSSLFRSRDKYLNKMVSTINRNSENVRKNMNVSIDNLKDIPIMNPNIEDFASIKMRYRDLRDRD